MKAIRNKNLISPQSVQRTDLDAALITVSALLLGPKRDPSVKLKFDHAEVEALIRFKQEVIFRSGFSECHLRPA
jgi:hypothetical protein